MSTLPTVAAALEATARWKAEEQSRQAAELVEVDQEIGKIEQNLITLQEQLAGLQTFRGELSAKTEGLEDAEISKSYEAVFGALQEQATAMGVRSELAAKVETERSAHLLDALRATDASLVDEYLQFKTNVAPTLANLPESYRSVIESHHKSQTEQLKERVHALTAEPATVDAPPLELDVVFAVDAIDGAAELVVIVLPVSEAVHTEWLAAPEGLATWLAARTVQGTYSFLKSYGPAGAQVMAGGHLGLLALELEVVGTTGSAEQLGAAISEAIRAPELLAAGVNVRATQVSIDHILPPEDDEADGEETIDA